MLHTSQWPAGGVDLDGKRVAVVGTGSTGIQVIQTIAPQVKELTVFQRTANFACPLKNRPISDNEFQKPWMICRACGSRRAVAWEVFPTHEL